jgi:hypothetical protein
VYVYTNPPIYVFPYSCMYARLCMYAQVFACTFANIHIRIQLYSYLLYLFHLLHDLTYTCGSGDWGPVLEPITWPKTRPKFIQNRAKMLTKASAYLSNLWFPFRGSKLLKVSQDGPAFQDHFDRKNPRKLRIVSRF